MEVDQLREEMKSDIKEATASLKDVVTDLKQEMRRGFDEITRRHVESMEVVRTLEKREVAHHERLQFVAERVGKIESTKSEAIENCLRLVAEQAKVATDQAVRMNRLEQFHEGGSSDGISRKKAAFGITIAGGSGFFLGKLFELVGQAFK